MSYPPFSRLARLLVPHVKSVVQHIDRMLSEFDVRVVGPAPHLVRRGFDVVLIKGKDGDVVRAACERVRNETAGAVEIDIDPERI